MRMTSMPTSPRKLDPITAARALTFSTSPAVIEPAVLVTESVRMSGSAVDLPSRQLVSFTLYIKQIDKQALLLKGDLF